jgi:DNA-binding CsgD family transcriptional regulator/tetratricopeptide (TPR) repeat protein
MSREAEMSRILTGLTESRPASFILAGAAGVGKTRLAAAAAESAAGLGFAVARAVATRGATPVPFGPFAPFLPVGQSTPDLLGLLRLASDAILACAPPGGKLLLTVDDAQFLDEGSAALLHQLVREPACGVVVTLRTPGQVPEAVTALWKDGLAERIDLRPWNESQTEAILAAYLGGPVASGSVRRLWELSQGNALYLRELLIGAIDSGTLRLDGGIWSLSRPLTTAGRLVELVAARLATLTPETVAVLELLAVGEPLGVAVLEKLTDPAGVEDAEAQGLVQLSTDGRRTQARLTHPIYAEALRSSMPRSRLRRISAALADAIAVTGARRRDDLLVLGRWQLDSGSAREAGILTQAAQRAGEMFDFGLAARLAQAALDANGGVDAGLALGEAMFRSGQHHEAEAVLAGVAATCQTDRDRARIASARAHIFANLLGDPTAAMAVLDDTLAVITDAAPRLQLLGRLAVIKVLEPDPEAALAAAGPLLASEDDVMASRGAYVSSIAMALLGRGQDAVSIAYVGLERQRRTVGMPQLPEAQLIGAVMGHVAAGRLAQAEADAETGMQASLAAGDKEGQATHLFLDGWVLIERGHLDRAVNAFLDGASVNREIHDPAALRWCLAGVALANAMRGRADEAQAAAAECDELPPSPMMLYETDIIERSRAWVSICGGELTRAREILTAAAERAAACQLRVAEAKVLHDVARIGYPEAVAPRLAVLAAEADGGLVAALARHATALVQADAAGLEAAGREFETLGASLLAAEAYQAAATAYQSHGQARSATAMTRQAAEIATVCGDARTPGMSPGATTWRLTRREQEIAAMAAAGASSREIADRLVLSVRTVENHLQNIYSKVGVTRREELVRLLGSAPDALSS